MTLSEDTKTTWPELDPDVLERIVPDTKGFSLRRPAGSIPDLGAGTGGSL